MIKLKDLLDQGIHDRGNFKCIFMAGMPGSGKSHISTQIFNVDINMSNFGLRVANSDYPFQKYLKSNNLPFDLRDKTMSDLTRAKIKAQREKAKRVFDTQFDLFMEQRRGVIIDLTGGDIGGVISRKQMAQRVGYDTMMIFVTVSMETALNRNAKRSRKVPEQVVRQKYYDLKNNIKPFRSLFGKNFFIIQNENDSKIASQVKSKIKAFLSAPPTNPLAIQWIKTQSEIRNIKEPKYVPAVGKDIKI